jgi:hypothetical protein
MRFRLAIAAGSLAIATSVSQAQTVDPQCSGAGQAQDICQQAVDLFRYMVPQLGIAIAGGNATLGQGGALGGFPHFTIGLRANLLAGSLPDVADPSVRPVAGAAQARNPYPTKNQFLGLPQIDAAIGLFKGLPFGVTNVGGVDLLLSANYIPKITGGDNEVSLEPETPIQVGFGVRVGLLQESLLVPGVSVTFLKRDLPTTTITGTVVNATTNDSLVIRDMSLKTTAWRIVASKSLILFTIAAGVGQDKYDASTTIRASLRHTIPPVTASATPTVEAPMTRTNYFADVSMNLLLLKLIGEIGMVSGGDMPTFSTFDKRADASRLYGSVGIRVGF